LEVSAEPRNCTTGDTQDVQLRLRTHSGSGTRNYWTKTDRAASKRYHFEVDAIIVSPRSSVAKYLLSLRHNERTIEPVILNSVRTQTESFPNTTVLGMGRPRVADRGDSLQIWRVVCEYVEYAVADSRHWMAFSLGVGRGAINSHRNKLYMLQSLYSHLGNGRILSHDLSTEKRIWDLARGMSGACIGQAYWKP
jgi:hypothetical protein